MQYPGLQFGACSTHCHYDDLNLSSTMQTQMAMLARGNHDNFTKNLQVPHVEVNGKLWVSSAPEILDAL